MNTHIQNRDQGMHTKIRDQGMQTHKSGIKGCKHKNQGSRDAHTQIRD